MHKKHKRRYRTAKIQKSFSKPINDETTTEHHATLVIYLREVGKLCRVRSPHNKSIGFLASSCNQVFHLMNHVEVTSCTSNRKIKALIYLLQRSKTYESCNFQIAPDQNLQSPNIYTRKYLLQVFLPRSL